MPGIYLIYGLLRDTDGSTPIANATVRGRNERTNTIITTTTDSTGAYILDFSSIDWDDGDTLTSYAIYQDYEDSESAIVDTTMAYYTEKNLTLVAIADSTLIDYCTVQDVYDEMEKTSTDISASRIIKAIQRAEGLIDLKTNTSFKQITVTDEVHTGDRNTLDISPDYLDTFSIGYNTRRDSLMGIVTNRVKTNYSPVVSITSLSVNQGGVNTADSWTALTQQTGSSGDYYLEDATVGIIDFLSNYPKIGKRSWKITYIYGYDRDSTNRRVIALLRVVERLTILLACKSIITAKSTGSMFDSTRSVRIGNIDISAGSMSANQYLNSIRPEIEELWKEIGDLGIEVI